MDVSRPGPYKWLARNKLQMRQGASPVLPRIAGRRTDLSSKTQSQADFRLPAESWQRSMRRPTQLACVQCKEPDSMKTGLQPRTEPKRRVRFTARGWMRFVRQIKPIGSWPRTARRPEFGLLGLRHPGTPEPEAVEAVGRVEAIVVVANQQLRLVRLLKVAIPRRPTRAAREICAIRARVGVRV